MPSVARFWAIFDQNGLSRRLLRKGERSELFAKVGGKADFYPKIDPNAERSEVLGDFRVKIVQNLRGKPPKMPIFAKIVQKRALASIWAILPKIGIWRAFPLKFWALFGVRAARGPKKGRRRRHRPPSKRGVAGALAPSATWAIPCKKCTFRTFAHFLGAKCTYLGRKVKNPCFHECALSKCILHQKKHVFREKR